MMIVLLPKHNVAPCKTSHQLIGIYAFLVSLSHLTWYRARIVET